MNLTILRDANGRPATREEAYRWAKARRANLEAEQRALRDEGRTGQALLLDPQVADARRAEDRAWLALHGWQI